MEVKEQITSIKSIKQLQWENNGEILILVYVGECLRCVRFIIIIFFNFGISGGGSESHAGEP